MTNVIELPHEEMRISNAKSKLVKPLGVGHTALRITVTVDGGMVSYVEAVQHIHEQLMTFAEDEDFADDDWQEHSTEIQIYVEQDEELVDKKWSKG
jgi:hypothetical protein